MTKPRTQAERRAETQHRILEATLACLSELGYAATSTPAVSKRAGVSRGALTHHFPTRSLLVSAAVRHLFVEIRASYQHLFDAVGPVEGLSVADRLDGAIDLLWGAYKDPSLTVIDELYVAGRTDPELRACLEPVAAQHRADIVRLARGYFPDLAGDPRFEPLMSLVLDALQGLVLRQVTYSWGSSAEESLATIKAIARVVTEGL